MGLVWKLAGTITECSSDGNIRRQRQPELYQCNKCKTITIK